MSLTPHLSFARLWAYELNWSQCLWGPRGGQWTSFRLPRNPGIAARVLLKRANLSFVLTYVMTDSHSSLHVSAIFLPVFCWLSWILVPSLHLWKQGDWIQTSQCQSLFGFTSIFHVVGRSLLGTSQNMTVRQRCALDWTWIGLDPDYSKFCWIWIGSGL